jgi:hypothetical protein
MKKPVVIFITLLLTVLPLSAQTAKRTVAITPTLGKSVDAEIRLMIRLSLEEGIANSDGYEGVVHDKVYKELTHEFGFLQSDAVRDDQLVEFGKAAGAQLVCFPSIQTIGRFYRINYKLVDVKRGKVVRMASETVRNGVEGLIDAAGKISSALFGTRSAW